MLTSGEQNVTMNKMIAIHLMGKDAQALLFKYDEKENPVNQG